MIPVKPYMARLLQELQKQFANRLLYVGLQGSYLRNEATENSDLDIVIILDGLSTKDLATYKTIVDTLPNSDKACGFICGKAEMGNWNPLEICNFLYGTKDYYGHIADFVPPFTKEDVRNFIKLSVGNLYHEICHRYIHTDKENNKRKLPSTYKGVFFILQSLYYLKDGYFYPTKNDLMAHLNPQDRTIMEMANQLRDAEDYDFSEALDSLLFWCQKVLTDVTL